MLTAYGPAFALGFVAGLLAPWVWRKIWAPPGPELPPEDTQW